MTSGPCGKKLTRMVTLPPLARLADAVLPDGLSAYISTARDDGKSWDTISRELWADTGKSITVTGPTLRSWATSLGIEPEAASA